MDRTKIDWCDSTWNPVTGCLHGCEYCYARGIANRFGGWEFSPGSLRLNVADEKTYIAPIKAYYGEAKETEYGKIAEINDPFIIRDKKAPYPFGFMPTFHRYRLNEYTDKKGRNIFVCSMADLFGAWVPDSWIEEVFIACRNAPQHNYLFLTKNPDRYVDLQDKGKLVQSNNMWYGASATNENQFIKAIRAFGDLKCSTKTFLSAEPLIEDITTTEYWNDCIISTMANWVIVGAETGRRKDKVVPERSWIRSIAFDCEDEIPIFMKSSLAEIWGEQLIQEFPEQLMRKK